MRRHTRAVINYLIIFCRVVFVWLLKAVRVVLSYRAPCIEKLHDLSAKINYWILFKYIANMLNTVKFDHPITIRQNSMSIKNRALLAVP